MATAPQVAPARDDAPRDAAEEPQTVIAPPPGRHLALGILVAFAVFTALHLAQEVFVPLVLGVLGSYALEPIVAWLGRFMPRPLASALVVSTLLVGLGLGVYGLSDDAGALLARIPEASQKLRQTMRRGGPSPIDKVQELAAEIEQSAAEAARPSPPPHGVTRVQIEEKPLDIRAVLWTGSMGILGLVGQGILLAFLVFFLLASGDLYKRKLVRIAGPSFTRKKVTVQVLDEIASQVQRFLFVQVVTSVLVGIVSWLAFRWFGLEQAAVWGVAAGVLNSIPYFGPVVVMAGVALVSFLQFGTVAMALSIALVSFLITSLEGFLLTPWLVGRAVQMNQVAVFAGLMFWGWLWGVVGLLLAVPMLVVVKSVCDRVEDLRPIGELLGE